MANDNKYLASKLVTKEASIANSSCRVYYGEAGAVPFMWESQPGTPKHVFPESSLPPLTPPPSYSTTPQNPKSTPKTTSKSKLLHTIVFPRLMSLKKSLLKTPSMSPPSSLSSASSSSSSASCSSSSWSSSWNSSNMKTKQGPKKNRSLSVSRMSFRHFLDDYDDDDPRTTTKTSRSSPTSTLCFGGKRKGTIIWGNNNFKGIRGCFLMKSIKIRILSIVNHESGRGTSA